MRMRIGRPRARKNAALRGLEINSDRHVTSDILLYYCVCMSTRVAVTARLGHGA